MTDWKRVLKERDPEAGTEPMGELDQEEPSCAEASSPADPPIGDDAAHEPLFSGRDLRLLLIPLILELKIGRAHV